MSYRFSREQLYNIVWAEPMQKVAARLGISDVGLAKACRAAEIPVPERGYWAKLQAGKQVEKRALPIRPLGMLDQVEIGLGTSSNALVEDDLASEPSMPASFAEPIPELIGRVRKLVDKVTCAKNLEGPHPEVARLIQYDERRRQKQLESSYPSIWDGPLFESPFERRRLRILNSLFVALTRCGAKPHVNARDGRGVSVLVGSVHIGCRLDGPKECEKEEHQNSVRQPDSRRPIGSLRFEIQSWWGRSNTSQHWDDTNDGKIEEVLTEIAVQILTSGEITLREWLQERHEEEVKDRAERQEKARRKREEDERKEWERIAQLEQDRVDQLVQSAASWRQAAEIRAYVRAVVDASSSCSSDEARRTLEAWTTWASGVADKIDPLVRKS